MISTIEKKRLRKRFNEAIKHGGRIQASWSPSTDDVHIRQLDCERGVPEDAISLGVYKLPCAPGVMINDLMEAKREQHSAF